MNEGSVQEYAHDVYRANNHHDQNRQLFPENGVKPVRDEENDAANQNCANIDDRPGQNDWPMFRSEVKGQPDQVVEKDDPADLCKVAKAGRDLSMPDVGNRGGPGEKYYKMDKARAFF